MKNYIFSDLACENVGGSGTKAERISERMQKIMFCDSRGADSVKCMTFYTPRMWSLSDGEFSLLSTAVAATLKETVTEAIYPRTTARVLIAGLGNPRISSDSLGARVIDGICIKVGKRESEFCVMAVAPDVSGNTGIETLDTMRAYVASSKAEVVVAVDALRSRSYQRLAATVQLSCGGIKPGSGVGGCRAELSRNTLGVPVVSMGIPTVISSATLIYDVISHFESSGIELTDILECSTDFLVTPKEIDLLIKSGGLLLSDAINKAFS